MTPDFMNPSFLNWQPFLHIDSRSITPTTTFLSNAIPTPSRRRWAILTCILFGEGKHEAVYEKLGAHVSKLGRISGVAFAVWAPGAAGVSVVGDFNGWDGRLHQMRRLGGSGVWELFIPDLAPGSLYKYEIRGRRGLPFLKADPYANYTEMPPDTSSIVYQSKYKFRDQQWMAGRVNREHFRQPLVDL